MGMRNYHVCASCRHYEIAKDGRKTTTRCGRLGYETKPDYKFNCWDPNENTKRLMEKERSDEESKFNVSRQEFPFPL